MKIKHILLVYNDRAGLAIVPKASLVEIFARLGVTCKVVSPDGMGSREVMHEGKYDAVVAAGGDGTVSAAAAAILRYQPRLPLGVVPVGTYNHFAKDAGLPLEVERAVTTIVDGHVRAVDVASVNGRTFVNNSSVGLYAASVNTREKYQPLITKYPALAAAFALTLLRLRRWRTTIEINGKRSVRRVSMIFVGNNKYHSHRGIFTERASLNGKVLSIYILKTAHPWRLMRTAWYALRGHYEKANGFEIITAQKLRIDVRARKIAVAFDGEVMRMRPPLEYVIHPDALRLLAHKSPAIRRQD